MSNRFVRFASQGDKLARYGIIRDDLVNGLESAPWIDRKETGERWNLNEVTLLAPVEPSKVVCIGLNYHAHVQASYSADEAPERPLIFLKPPSAIIGSGQAIVHTKQAQRVDYEAELGVIVGRTARRISETEAEAYIFGFAAVNDVTARDLQKGDGQWSRAKGFDTFCPVGPWIVDELNFSNLLVEGILNGEVKQSGRTSQMIFDIPFLISYISSVMTLYPGDLISTGTPAGIAPMKPGDTIEVRIEGVGTLSNEVVADD